MVGKNIERLRLEQGIKQKDFISKLQVYGLDINRQAIPNLRGRYALRQTRKFFTAQRFWELRRRNFSMRNKTVTQSFVLF